MTRFIVLLRIFLCSTPLLLGRRLCTEKKWLLLFALHLAWLSKKLLGSRNQTDRITEVVTAAVVRVDEAAVEVQEVRVALVAGRRRPVVTVATDIEDIGIVPAAGSRKADEAVGLGSCPCCGIV